jgi:putative Mg2+ transporter-C (MgtC) family protein
MFGSLANEAFQLDLLAKLALAVILGGAIGLERELKSKPAGLRTNILICLGAALITHMSIQIGFQDGKWVGDPTRIAAQIVSGVGFLGAGTILHGGATVTGLTSAATIWVVAGIGIAIGGGNYVAATGTTALVTIVLAWLGRVEHRIKRVRRVTHLTIRTKPGTPIEGIVSTLAEEGIKVTRSAIYDHPRDRTFELTLSGPAVQFEIVPQRLLERGDVVSVSSQT